VVGSYYAARHVRETKDEDVTPEPDPAIMRRLETRTGL